jgi:hypothetical protein
VPKLTLDQIVRLYELEPWQRLLLEDMLRADEQGWREREAFRDSIPALVDEVEREVNAFLGLTGTNFDSRRD